MCEFSRRGEQRNWRKEGERQKSVISHTKYPSKAASVTQSFIKSTFCFGYLVHSFHQATALYFSLACKNYPMKWWMGVFNSVYEMKQEGQAGRLGRVVLPKPTHLWIPLMAPSSFSSLTLIPWFRIIFPTDVMVWKLLHEDRRSYSIQSPAPGVWDCAESHQNTNTGQNLFLGFILAL